MSDRLQWVLNLEDRLSGPGARIERQLGRVRTELKVLDVQAKQSKLNGLTDPLKRQRAELQLQRDKLLLNKDALGKTGHVVYDLTGKRRGLREGVRDSLLILDVLARGFHFAAGKAIVFGSAVAKAVSFRQSSLIGLETMFGEGGTGVFDRLAAMAGKIGKPIEQLVNLGRSLANVGVKESDIEPMVRLIEDLDAMDPGAGDKLAGVMRGIFATGFMGAGDIESLRGTLLKPEKLYEDVSRKLGGTGDRLHGKMALEALSSVGKGIPKNTASQLLLQNVLDLEGGSAGAKSGRAGQTLQARIDRVGTQIERMFSRLAGSRGVKAFQKVLDNLIDLFNPDSKSGNAMLARLNDLSDVFARILDPLTGPEGKKRMLEFFDALAGAVEKVMPGLKALVDVTARFFGNIGALKGLATDEITTDPTSALTKEARKRAQRQGRVISPGSSLGMAPVVNLTQHIDARGASKEDAEHMADMAAQKAKDAVTEQLVGLAMQLGVYPP